MSDEKGGNPVRRQRPALRRAHRFRTNELARQNERHRAEAKGEADHEREHGDGREDGKALADAHGEQKGAHSHARGGDEKTGAAAEPVDERGEEGGGDGAEEGDEHIQKGRVGREKVGEKGDAVHDDAVNACMSFSVSNDLWC